MNRTLTVPAGLDAAVYARALADVISLRPYGTYQVTQERLEPTPDAKCGSRGGYTRHRGLGERACTPCLDANTAADRRLRATGTSKAATA